MRVLVACERFGVIRDAFIKAGHDAMSCDLVDTLAPGPHYAGDVRDILHDGWDLMIAHPPCTFLCSSGLHWNTRRPERAAQTDEAVEFVRRLLAAPIPRIAVENPIGCLSTRIRKPDQIVQPWQFGEDASKATCFWLVGLPFLEATNIIKKDRYANQTASGQNKLPPSPDRWKERSRTYEGIAAAMASQWGCLK